MAWCEECDTLVEDEDLGTQGECPACGTVLADQERQPVPYYFKFMLLATIVYLGWRIFQLVSWASHHF